MSAPAACTIRAASAIGPGSLAEELDRERVLVRCDPEVPERALVRCSIPAQLTISEQTRPAP